MNLHSQHSTDQQHDGLENTKQVGTDSIVKFPIYWNAILDSRNLELQTFPI